MKPGFGGSRGQGSGRGPNRPFNKFRKDTGFDRNAAVPDQRFGGPGKPGFAKPRDEEAPRGRGFRDQRDDRPAFGRDQRDDRGGRAPARPSEDRPFFPKSAPRDNGYAPSDRPRREYGAPQGGQRDFGDRPQRFPSDRPQGGRSYGAPQGREDRSFAPRNDRGPSGFDRPRAPRDQGGFDRPHTPRDPAGFDRPAAPYGAPREGGFDGPRAPRPRRMDAPRDDRPVREPKVTDSVEEVEAAEIVCGIHAVEALLENSPRRVQRLLLLRANNDTRLHKLQTLAEAERIPCQQIDSRNLDIKTPGRKNQGVVALCNARDYTEWSKVRADLKSAIAQGKAPVVLVASAIEDPRNLGAIARTCVGMGVDALILPMKGGCGLTSLADETSAGSLSLMPVARPHDLEKSLKELADDGFTLVGLDADGDDIRTIDFTGPVVIVAGGEDRGIPPHMRRPCHRVASIPMESKLQSYNASVAAAITLWEVRRCR